MQRHNLIIAMLSNDSRTFGQQAIDHQPLVNWSMGQWDNWSMGQLGHVLLGLFIKRAVAQGLFHQDQL